MRHKYLFPETYHESSLIKNNIIAVELVFVGEKYQFQTNIALLT